MTRAFQAGFSFWLPMRQIAIAYFGPNALVGGSGPIIAGVVTHLSLAAFFGGLIGLAIGKRAALGAFTIGLAGGLVVWSLMTFLVLPWANQILSDRIGLMSGRWLAFHVIFGVTLSIIPAVSLVIGRLQMHLPSLTRRAVAEGRGIAILPSVEAYTRRANLEAIIPESNLPEPMRALPIATAAIRRELQLAEDVRD